MGTAAVPARLEMFGLGLLNLDRDASLAAIEAALAANEPKRIAFVNADCINLGARDPEYRRQLARMDWVFIDGIGMRIAGRLLGQQVRDNVNGTDLFPPLCAALARDGRRLYLLGARPGVAAAAAEWAVARFPGLQIAGCRDGYFAADEEATIVEEIRRAHTDVLLVALGAPRQEAWIDRNAIACGTTIAIGVGGLFDYYSGRIPRAPRWMRRAGLEWLFRLIQEPGRLWRRYLVGNFIFLARACVALLRPPACPDAPRRES